jgi:hypothetical protein
VPSQGTFEIRSLTGDSALADPDWLAPFEVTEEQARRWAKDQLGQTLDELKGAIDGKLAEWRRQLDEFKKTPVAPDTDVTPDATTAILDFFRQLPRVVGQSLSGDEDRVESARTAMTDLQRRLQDAGVEVDDRVKAFPDRLAELRKDSKPDADPE